MTIWELPVLCAVSILGGIKSICGTRICKGEKISISDVWSEPQMYMFCGSWLVLCGLFWYGFGRSVRSLQFVDLLGTYVILAIVDGKRRIVPGSILLCYFAGQMLLGALSLTPAGLLWMILSGGIFAVAMYAFVWCSKGKMGMGDAMLLGVTAMTAGWEFTLQILILAVAFSFLYSIWLLAVCKKSIQTEFPFVPFLAAGTAVSVLLLA